MTVHKTSSGDDKHLGITVIVDTGDVIEAINSLPDVLFGVIDAELEAQCEKILAASRMEVPWDTTTLLQSGKIEKGVHMMEYDIGYTEPYAARQHEDLDLHHPKPGRKAKFLEDPARAAEPMVVMALQRAANAMIGDGIPSMTAMSNAQRTSIGHLGGRYI